MANKDAVGTTGEPFELDVERGKIREFARATLSENPAYLESERPVSPPTFLTTMFFWETPASRTWAAVDLDQKRGLHAEQEFIFHGPPPSAGERLVGTNTISEIYTKQGRRGGEMTFATQVTEFRDASGRVVAQARLTGVETARPPAEETNE